MTEHLTKDTFIEKVFDFEKNKEWKYNGELPCIIDFYADWCAPCKMVAPILEELSEEFKGQMNVYKVNTEKEQVLASVFGIRSIPSMLFVPKDEILTLDMDIEDALKPDKTPLFRCDIAAYHFCWHK